MYLKEIKLTVILGVYVLFIYSGCSSDDDLQNLPPNEFALIGVTDGAVEVSLNPVFSWTEATDQEYDEITYALILDQNPNPSTVVAENITDSTYELLDQSLSMYTTYYWKIIAEDDVGNMTESEVYSFQTRGLNLPPFITLNPFFHDRYNHASVAFNNKLWIIGGWSNHGSINNALWSIDGLSWTGRGNGFTSFSERNGHKAVVLNEKVWIIGGNGPQFNGDIWSSSDGLTWTKEVDTAPFSAPRRTNHEVVIFNDKMWLIGGYAGIDSRNDVWSSTDGINWIEVTSNAPFPPRFNHAVTIFDDKIWIIGGYVINVPGADIWYSSDGLTWTEATSNAPFSERNDHAVAVFDEKMWVIGGRQQDPNELLDNSTRVDDIWYSRDGFTWELAVEHAPFSRRFGHTVVNYNNNLWLIGGWDALDLQNDVWTLD